MFPEPRIVLDTNILLRTVANPSAASGMIVDACETRRIILLLSSKGVLTEYLTVLRDSDITGRHRAITPPTVDNMLNRLRYVADRYAITPRFRFPRDPRDACFLELAIAGKATQLITNDNDFLSLPTAHTDAARRFRQRLPSIQIMRPADFVRAFPRLFPQK